MGMMAKSRHAAGFLLSFRSCLRKVMLGSQENMAVSASYHVCPVVCVNDIHEGQNVWQKYQIRHRSTFSSLH